MQRSRNPKLSDIARTIMQQSVAITKTNIYIYTPRAQFGSETYREEADRECHDADEGEDHGRDQQAQRPATRCPHRQIPNRSSIHQLTFVLCLSGTYQILPLETLYNNLGLYEEETPAAVETRAPKPRCDQSVQKGERRVCGRDKIGDGSPEGLHEGVCVPQPDGDRRGMRAGGSYGDRSQKLCCNESEDPQGRAQTCRGLGCWASRARADPGKGRAGRSHPSARDNESSTTDARGYKVSGS